MLRLRASAQMLSTLNRVDRVGTEASSKNPDSDQQPFLDRIAIFLKLQTY